MRAGSVRLSTCPCRAVRRGRGRWGADSHRCAWRRLDLSLGRYHAVRRRDVPLHARYFNLLRWQCLGLVDRPRFRGVPCDDARREIVMVGECTSTACCNAGCSGKADHAATPRRAAARRRVGGHVHSAGMIPSLGARPFLRRRTWTKTYRAVVVKPRRDRRISSCVRRGERPGGIWICSSRSSKPAIARKTVRDFHSGLHDRSRTSHSEARTRRTGA